MKCASVPSSYRNCRFLTSVCTREKRSPARKVRSTTAPEPSAFSFVRTNAPPFPGFTCWNSTMRQGWPSSSMCMPFLNWFVETCSATAAECSGEDDRSGAADGGSRRRYPGGSCLRRRGRTELDVDPSQRRAAPVISDELERPATRVKDCWTLDVEDEATP